MLFAKFKLGGGVLPVFWLELGATSVAEAQLITKGIITGYIMATKEPIELLDIRLSRHPSETTYTLEELQGFFLPVLD